MPSFIRSTKPKVKGALDLLSAERLAQMSSVDITRIGALADISKISVDPAQPRQERLERYLGRIKNPYCFLYGHTPVKLVFDPSGKPLEELLLSYFDGLGSR